jgi:TonB family protein
MGKIVKYCTKCEEGFASKFEFCPNCGENLQAFEMNPVKRDETAAVSAISASSAPVETASPASFETKPLVEEHVVPATAAFADNDILELDSVDVAERAEEQETIIAIPTNGNGNGNGYHADIPAETATYNFSREETTPTVQSYDSYNPTVIEERDNQLRNGLLAGFGSLFIAAVLIAWVWSLFVHSLPVFALDSPNEFAFVGPIEAEPVETEPPPKKNDDEGGGGGGGGQENQQDATKGRLPTQSKDPKNPILMVTQMTNPTFVVRNETKGDNVRPPTNEVVGLPNGLTADNLSGGRGKGGGLGNGDGRGAGNGKGLGEGNGCCEGSGDGNGKGNGDGDGDGDNGPKIAKVEKIEKPANSGVTVGIKILSKPQARYTDAGRQNNVQGTVTLKVTFTASGAIGSITAVSGLPYGLTEQAIAAARQIKFEPAMRNGVPYSLTKTVSYSFTIY